MATFVPTTAVLSTAPPGARVFIPTVVSSTFTRSDIPQVTFTVAFYINSYLASDGSTQTFTLSQFDNLAEASIIASMVQNSGGNAIISSSSTKLRTIVIPDDGQTITTVDSTGAAESGAAASSASQSLVSGERASPSETAVSNHSSNGALIGGAVAGGVVALVVLLGVVIFWVRRRRSRMQATDDNRDSDTTRWEKAELHDSAVQRAELDDGKEIREMYVPVDPVEMPDSSITVDTERTPDWGESRSS